MLRQPLRLAATVAFVSSTIFAVHAFGDDQVAMTFYPQQETNWCWAAVTQTIATHNRGAIEQQCQMASRFVHKTTDNYCCYASTAETASCNQGYYPAETMTFYGVLDQYFPSPITHDQMQQEVRGGYPVAAAVMWPAGGGHAILFYGAQRYQDKAGQTFETVNIFDPAAGGDKVVMSRAQAERYQGGTWRYSFTSKCANNAC